MKINLPNISITPIKVSLGEVHHVLRMAEEVDVLDTDLINISPRIKEFVYTLSNGEKLLVLNTLRKIDIPQGVDGIIIGDQVGGYKWVSHKIIQNFEREAKENGVRFISQSIAESWKGQFDFKEEIYNTRGELVSFGLRPPQLGALFAIGAHWSLYNKPATVVMPTGTGKTETMLSTLANFGNFPLLVIVPSDALRNQTAKKFLTFGLLRKIGALTEDVKNPIVGIITKRPKSIDDLDIFKDCNVVIATMASLLESDTSDISDRIADMVDTLIVDEAHHLGAKSWNHFRQSFKLKKVLQFTATPYRRDGRLVDGTVIYNYPLGMAQNDNYFKKIVFEPVYANSKEESDVLIADKAINKLKADTELGLNHLLMARCGSINRAEEVFKIYSRKASEFKPVLIHSKSKSRDYDLRELQSGNSKIVVCVDMLGEGFDLPELKIAAIHDIHKSLGIILQFTGRFTRTNSERIGDATVIANIADANVSDALAKLYSEDSDWNKVLSEMSSDAAKEHAELVNFLESSEPLKESEDNEIPMQLLNPVMSTLLFSAENFSPKKFHEGVPKNLNVRGVWLNNNNNTLFFTTKSTVPLKWARTKNVMDVQWDVFILHYDEQNKLLYLASSDKSSNFEGLAEAVGATKQISGERMFRALSNINRLRFQNVGVTKHGRRNLRYAMYTGEDVAKALSDAEKVGSRKANITGTGWEDGFPMTIGCSYKGRVWSRDQGSIPKLVKWCEGVGDKIIDETIDTSEIIKNAMIVQEITELPDSEVLGIEYPIELLQRTEDKVILSKEGSEDKNLSMFDILYLKMDRTTNSIYFSIENIDDGEWGQFQFQLEQEKGFVVRQICGEKIDIRIGTKQSALEEYFSSFPPLIRFVDFSEVDANVIIKPNNPENEEISPECFEVLNWTGVDIQKESTWKAGVQRVDSVQSYVSSEFINKEYDVVFDDDGAGEAADLVCIKDYDDHIDVVLVHCKYSGASYPGSRITDVPEVCSQAARSAKWKVSFKKLCQHLRSREKNLNSNRNSRLVRGTTNKILYFEDMSKNKEIRFKIWIAQPGISKQNLTTDQFMVLSATASYLKQTIGVDLKVLCSM